MARTTDADVRALIEIPVTATTAQFISMASRIVDRVAAVGGMLDEELADMEALLAAHFLALRWARWTKRKAGDAEEDFRQPATALVGLKATPYGQQALMLDTTGVLAQVQNDAETPQKTVGITALCYPTE